jgi:DhnA family fructose-bisphosphate aldolase class Ia
MNYCWAKARRLKKLQKENYYLILAMDHALSSGPIKGIDSIKNVNHWIAFSETHHIPAVVLNNRYIYNLNIFSKINIVVQTMGLVECQKNINKVPLTNIDDITLVDGTAVSVQINFKSENLDEAIQNITEIVSKANQMHYPLLFMVGDSDWEDAQSFKYAVRVCTELGADLIKIHLPSDPQMQQELTPYSRDEPALLLAGGENMNAFQERISSAKALGFQGICLGRNIFQSEQPEETLKIIEKVFGDH